MEMYFELIICKLLFILSTKDFEGFYWIPLWHLNIYDAPLFS